MPKSKVRIPRKIYKKDFSRATKRDAKRYINRFGHRILANYRSSKNPYFQSMMSALKRISNGN